MDLQAEFDKCKSLIETDEWAFANIYNRIREEMIKSEAFYCIPKAIKLVLCEKEYICEAMNLLLTIVVATDTTEMHPEMEQELPNLRKHICGFGKGCNKKFLELLNWYRIKK
jgi:hypothetical protein